MSLSSIHEVKTHLQYKECLLPYLSTLLTWELKMPIVKHSDGTAISLNGFHESPKSGCTPSSKCLHTIKQMLACVFW